MPGCSWARLNSGLVKVTRLHMDTVITNNGKMKQRRICQGNGRMEERRCDQLSPGSVGGSVHQRGHVAGMLRHQAARVRHPGDRYDRYYRYYRSYSRYICITLSTMLLVCRTSSRCCPNTSSVSAQVSLRFTCSSVSSSSVEILCL